MNYAQRFWYNKNNFWRCYFILTRNMHRQMTNYMAKCSVCVRECMWCARSLYYLCIIKLIYFNWAHYIVNFCDAWSTPYKRLYVLFNRKYSSWRRNENSMYPWMRVMWNLNFTFGWLFLWLPRCSHCSPDYQWLFSININFNAFLFVWFYGYEIVWNGYYIGHYCENGLSGSHHVSLPRSCVNAGETYSINRHDCLMVIYHLPNRTHIVCNVHEACMNDFKWKHFNCYNSHNGPTNKLNSSSTSAACSVSQRDKWKRKWPIENLSEQVQTMHSEIRKMAVIFEWIIFFGRQASLTFASPLIPSIRCKLTVCAVFRNGLIVFEHEKQNTLQYIPVIPVIIVDIIASYGYYDFWQWLFCKTNQRFLDATRCLCILS